MVGFSVGSRIAGYRLEEQIGEGGMAVVFRARDERLQRQVALKILSPALAADEEFRRRFIRESRSAAAVDDPHIIPVFEAGDANGVLFIAMRYVPGGDVGTLVRRLGPLPNGLALSDHVRAEQVKLDFPGDVGDAGLAGLAGGEVAGFLGLAGAGPVRAVPDEGGGGEDLQQERGEREIGVLRGKKPRRCRSRRPGHAGS